MTVFRTCMTSIAGSSSPRNSYIQQSSGGGGGDSPRQSAGQSVGTGKTARTDSAESSGSGSPETDSASSPQSSPAHSHFTVGDSPSLERSPLLVEPSDVACTAGIPASSPGGSDVTVTWSRGTRPFRIPRGASAMATNDGVALCAAGNHVTGNRRSPPQSLDIVPVAEVRVEDSSATRGESNPRNNGAASGDSETLAEGAAGCGPRARREEVSPLHARPVLQSPLSPTAHVAAMPRSGSIASQVMWHCNAYQLELTFWPREAECQSRASFVVVVRIPPSPAVLCVYGEGGSCGFCADQEKRTEALG